MVAITKKSIFKEPTPRQRQIWHYVCRGYGNREIAEALGLRENTVGTHRKMLNRRLGVRSTAGLVLQGVKYGIVEVPK